MTGKGHAMVVVRPGSLRETTQVLEACLEAGVAIVPQGWEEYHGDPWAIHFSHQEQKKRQQVGMVRI